MNSEFFKLYIRLTEYAAFVGIRLPLALKELSSIMDEISDEILPK